MTNQDPSGLCNPPRDPNATTVSCPEGDPYAFPLQGLPQYQNNPNNLIQIRGTIVVVKSKPRPRPISPPAPPVDFMQYTVCGGGLFGICGSFTGDKCGHTYFGIGPTVGRADPISVAITQNSLYGNDHSEKAVQNALSGPGYQITAGVWAGAQVSGPLWPPGPPSSHGAGVVSPQYGASVGWTWQLPENPVRC